MDGCILLLFPYREQRLYKDVLDISILMNGCILLVFTYREQRLYKDVLDLYILMDWCVVLLFPYREQRVFRDVLCEHLKTLVMTGSLIIVAAHVHFHISLTHCSC